jgi:predicted CoA-binding protein
MKPTVAVVGAGSDRRKFGNKAVRAYLRAGYEVFPIHPTETQVEGVPAYRSVADVPRDRLDRVAVYLPPAVGLKVLDEIAAKPATDVYLNPGADAPEVVEKARRLGLNVVTGCAIVAVGASPAMFPDE